MNLRGELKRSAIATPSRIPRCLSASESLAAEKHVQKKTSAALNNSHRWLSHWRFFKSTQGQAGLKLMLYYFRNDVQG